MAEPLGNLSVGDGWCGFVSVKEILDGSGMGFIKDLSRPFLYASPGISIIVIEI